jgi:Flp pilus assembly protein TadD
VTGSGSSAPVPAPADPQSTPGAGPAAAPGAATADAANGAGAAATTELPALSCESADSDTTSSDPDSGLASESFAAQRIRVKPTAASRIGCALRRGRRTAALQIADEYLADHPRDAQVRFLRAVILGDLGRVTESATMLEALTQDFPELAEPYNNLAAIRANQGDLAVAEHYLRLAIAAEPNYVTARENLGDLYISLAAATYDQALHLSPGSAAIRKKLILARELGAKLHGTH